MLGMIVITITKLELDKMNRMRQAQKATFQFAISFQIKIIDWMQTLLSYEAGKKEDTMLYWLMSPLTASLVIWCDFCTSHLELISQLVMLSKPTAVGQSTSSNKTIVSRALKIENIC
jgi:hypothetical protein